MNPLIFRKGVCDPHIHIFEGRAYMYATHDAPGYEDNFHMDDWQIWSSDNLIDWILESIVHPEDFYCGSLNQCWAVDAAYKDGKYYLYYSTGDWGVGVAVSDSPKGPFKDPLGKALVDYRDHPVGIPKWDPCVFQDEDGAAYLIVGTCRQEEPWNCYLIARLDKDMIHLSEPLRKIKYIGNPWPEDKASVHKYHGKYYLTHSSYYSVSDSVYGPYEYVGNTGCNIDHGSYFTYHNQTYFASGGMDNPNRYLRASFLAPCHYGIKGDIVIDQKPMEYGCGQYDSTWERIEASWYFAASRECKKENKQGEFLIELLSGEYVSYPEIANIEENAKICFYASSCEEAIITIHSDKIDGQILGKCKVGRTWDCYAAKLTCTAGKKSLHFVADGEVEIRYFSFPTNKKKSVIEPAFSKVGRGASAAYDLNAVNHQILQNMELRGAAVEGLADGGNGGIGILRVSYCCTGEAVSLHVYINEEYQGIFDFPVTEEMTLSETSLSKTPCVSEKEILLQPGLNRIRIVSEEYQNGRLAIDQIVVESKKTNCAVYAAANGMLDPRGNGCWDGFPQRETALGVFSGRIVKYLEKPGDEVRIDNVDGGDGGTYKLDIHYCRGEEGISDYQLLINEKDNGIISFSYTGGFGVDDMKIHTVEIQLDRGNNILCLRKTGRKDKGIFVDAFAVMESK